MNSAVEDKLIDAEKNVDAFDFNDEVETSEENEQPKEESSEFALKMINSVKAMNNDEITHYEMVNNFTTIFSSFTFPRF